MVMRRVCVSLSRVCVTELLFGPGGRRVVRGLWNGRTRAAGVQSGLK